MSSNIMWFADIGLADLEQVGGKNSSLGEMIGNLSAAGVLVPDGFATTADAYWSFIGDTGLADLISAELAGLDTDDVRRLAEVGSRIRAAVVDQPFPAGLEADIRTAYERLAGGDEEERSFAVRSSATAEDLPDASFAGQQETFLNVRGIDAILVAVRQVFASLFNDRAIAYRVHHGFAHEQVALSAGVQQMVRSDVGASGVMFTVDTESGFPDAVFITSSYGLGEAVVQGAVNPDEFYVYKPALKAGRPAILKRGIGSKATKMIYTADPTVGKTTEFVDVPAADRRLLSLTDAEVEELARQAVAIEEHYGRPMDIEWGKDGVDGRLYILQARPETVQSRQAVGSVQRFRMDQKGPVLVEGRAIGQRIGAGPVRVLQSVDAMHEFVPGEVLVADMTDPDWEPIMKRAAAIVTNRGGRTCHAAIIARELGIPAVVGTSSATRDLADGRPVTVSCAEGDTGFVYDGILDFTVESTELAEMPDIPVKIMMNVGTPDQAFAFSRLPNAGVGLARLEFIINRQIGIHPKALLEIDQLEEPLKGQVAEAVAAYPSPREFFVTRVAEGVAMLGGRVRAASGDRADVGLQVQRVRQPGCRGVVRAARGEPDDRLPGRLPLPVGGLRRLLRNGMPGAEVCPGRDGADQREDHDPVRPHPDRGRRGDRPARTERPATGRQRPAGDHDVRAAVQRRHRRRVPGPLRRVLYRVQRHDPAHPWHRPRLSSGRRRLR